MRRLRVEPPMWLLVTLMTIALGVAVWAVAQDRLEIMWPF